MISPRHLLILTPLFMSLSAVAAEQRGAAPATPAVRALPSAPAPGVQATLPPLVVNPGLPVLPPAGASAKTTPLPPPLPRSLKCDVSMQLKNPQYGTPYAQVVLRITNDLGGRETIPAGSVIEWSYETTSGKDTLGFTLLPGQSFPVQSMQKGVGALAFPMSGNSSNKCSAALLP